MERGEIVMEKIGGRIFSNTDQRIRIKDLFIHCERCRYDLQMNADLESYESLEKKLRAAEAEFARVGEGFNWDWWRKYMDQVELFWLDMLEAGLIKGAKVAGELWGMYKEWMSKQKGVDPYYISRRGFSTKIHTMSKIKYKNFGAGNIWVYPDEAYLKAVLVCYIFQSNY